MIATFCNRVQANFPLCNTKIGCKFQFFCGPLSNLLKSQGKFKNNNNVDHFRQTYLRSIVQKKEKKVKNPWFTILFGNLLLFGLFWHGLIVDGQGTSRSGWTHSVPLSNCSGVPSHSADHVEFLILVWCALQCCPKLTVYGSYSGHSGGREIQMLIVKQWLLQWSTDLRKHI